MMSLSAYVHNPIKLSFEGTPSRRDYFAPLFVKKKK